MSFLGVTFRDSDRGRFVGSAQVAAAPKNDGFLEYMKLRLGWRQLIIPVCDFLLEYAFRLIAFDRERIKGVRETCRKAGPDSQPAPVRWPLRVHLVEALAFVPQVEHPVVEEHCAASGVGE